MHPATTTLCLFFVTALTDALSEHPIVIVMSFDGLRYEFINETDAPTLHKLIGESTFSKNLKPVFPTTSEPNHITIVIGLNSGDHGVIDQFFLDVTKYVSSQTEGNDSQSQITITTNQPEPFKTKFEYKGISWNLDYQNRNDQEVVPIWVENKKKNGGLSGLMMWPGTTCSFAKNEIQHYLGYSSKVTYETRVQIMIDWMTNNKVPQANLVMGYFEHLKMYLKVNGLRGSIKFQIKEIDDAIKQMLNWIKKQDDDAQKKISLIILGGHGMESVEFQNIICLKDLLSSISVSCKSCDNYLAMGANALVIPQPSELESVYTYLKQKSQNKFHVYKQSEIPDEWKIKNARQLEGAIFLKAESGHGFLEENNEQNIDQSDVGMDGYYTGSSNDSKLNTIFIGWGSRFKKNNEVLPLDMMEIHPLLKHLLNIEGLSSKVQPFVEISENVKKMLA